MNGSVSTQGPAYRPSGRLLNRITQLSAALRVQYEARCRALDRYLASVRSTSLPAQREFWFEFCELDQEFRASTARLAELCNTRSQRSERTDS